MPLLKRKPFSLLEPPEDLKPSELVYQVRFTKEILRDYNEYLNRINLYRRRIWSCKVTGKGNLTYEEALVSEQRATEKVQQFPKELMEPVLKIIQFSLIPLRDLVNTITRTLRDSLLEDVEQYAKKENCLHPCKIIKVVENGDKTQYQVGWLDSNNKITGKDLVSEDELIRKKLPFSRKVLMSFIRESTCQNCPWVLHDKLAQKHGISTDPPQELKDNFIFCDGHLVRNKKRRKSDDDRQHNLVDKRKKGEGLGDVEKEDEKPEAVPIKYPIDDLLVQSDDSDLALTNRPSPSSAFIVPMDCVGDLLMVWDFCSSFRKLLRLSPFPLGDFEKAICHKESNPVLIVEAHATILRFLLKDNIGYFLATQKKRQKSKITLINWTEYLCDFLEMNHIPELSTYVATIKRGRYGFLDIQAKLGILRGLVAKALTTDIFREMLDENIEQRQALGATRRGEALEEGRKKREKKERLKAVSNTNEQSLEHLKNGFPAIDDKKKNGDVILKRNNSGPLSGEKDASVQSEDKHANEAKEKKNNEERKEFFEREMDKLIIRTNALGKDRNYNRYWFFRRDGRIFIESSDSKDWGYYSAKEEVDALMESLNCKGVRERALFNQLKKYYRTICSELHKSSREAALNAAKEESVRRSTRVRAPPGDNPALAFLKYENKWKDE